MSDLNTLTISGRLTHDPLAVNGGNGCRLNIASNRQYQSKSATDGWANDVLYIEATAWSFAATKCLERLVKGDAVTITGRLELNSYEAKDGTQRKQHRVVINQIDSPAFTKRYERTFEVEGELPTTTVREPQPETVAVGAPDDSDIPF
jgi:single-strand DNA-binding protein